MEQITHADLPITHVISRGWTKMWKSWEINWFIPLLSGKSRWHRNHIENPGSAYWIFDHRIFFAKRLFCECLLITRRIVIKKSICVIPFHVVQQGYTVRLNTGSFPFQKINLLYSLQSWSLHRAILCCAHSKFHIGTFK